MKAFGSTACVLILFGGCPKRQTTPRIVYVPAPPAAAAESQPASPKVMVITEPAPEPVAQAPAEPKPAPHEETIHRRRPVHHTEPAPPAEQPEPATPMPALQTSRSPAQTVALQKQVSGMQNRLQQQITQLSRSALSGADRQTLDGARAFLAQSLRALQDSDLQRALNLARKAQLLVQAVQDSQ